MKRDKITVNVTPKLKYMIDGYVKNAWIWILILGIVNTGIGCYLYFSPLSKLPVQTVAICGYLEPLSAVAFSVIFLGERMTLIQITGAVCIIGELVRKKNASF